VNYSFLITISLALAWMFSPDSLVLQGNGAGSGMALFFPALAVGGIVSSACIFFLHHPKLGECSEKHSPPTTFIIAYRLSLVLFLPTGMLVTAGFTFNETFVYWFPNFGFSFLLLGFILTLHLIGEKIAAAVQPLFIGTTLICLLLLSIFGINGQEIYATPTEPAFSFSVHLSISSLVLFLGYDSVNGQTTKHRRMSSWWAIGAGYLVLTLWAMASLSNVNPATLADSTVPYVIVAHKILGQPGRIIMGIIIISGTLGCVNALFILANRSMVPLTKHFFLRFPAGTMLKKRIYPFLFSVLISSFMAAGMAGGSNLEIYIRGALMLWLLSIGIHCFTATRILRILGKTIAGFGYILSMSIIISTFYLIFSHSQNIQILGFCCLNLAVSFIISRCLLHLNRQLINTKTEP
jgi:hypothetical protein